MSADAKVWKDGDWWKGCHDGTCEGEDRHAQGNYDLEVVIRAIVLCMDASLRWEFRTYPDGQIGLVGFVA